MTRSDSHHPPNKLSARELAALSAGALGFYLFLIVSMAVSRDGKLWFLLIDDAAISMRYGRHLAEGWGFVWNPGEPPIEGFTNPLWMLWMALWHGAPLPENLAALPIQLTGAVILCGIAWTAARLAEELGGGRMASAGAWMASALCYPLVFWTLRGMETGLAALWLTGALLWAARWENDAAGFHAKTPRTRRRKERKEEEGVWRLGVGGWPGARDAGERRRMKSGALLSPPEGPGDPVLAWGERSEPQEPEAAPRARHPETRKEPSLGFSALRSSLAIFASLREIFCLPGAMAGVCLALALLTRADGVVPVALIGAWAGAWALWRRDWRGLLALGAFPAIAWASVQAWRWITFGDFFPNTYYLKVGGAPASERLAFGWANLLSHGGLDDWAVLAGAMGAGLLAGGRPRRWMFGAPLLLLAGQQAYSLWAGGDYAELRALGANRFVALALPGMIAGTWVLAEAIVWRLSPNALETPKRGQTLALGLLLGLGLTWLTAWPEWSNWRLQGAPDVARDANRAQLGTLLRETTAPDAAIGVHSAGQLSYFSRRRIVDLLGKNDAIVARSPAAGPFYPGHNKWNYAHSVGRLKPDVIVSFDRDFGLNDYLKAQEGAGYRRLPNGLLIREDSKRILDPEKLGALSPKPFRGW